MPSRVRNHVLETLSRDELSRLISGPLGWVVRDVAIDYGIDVNVEIFDDRGEATGLTFKVQLEGMERPDRIGPRSGCRPEGAGTAICCSPARASGG